MPKHFLDALYDNFKFDVALMSHSLKTKGQIILPGFDVFHSNHNIDLVDINNQEDHRITTILTRRSLRGKLVYAGQHLVHVRTEKPMINILSTERPPQYMLKA